MKQTAVGWLEKELIKRFKRNQLHYTDSEWCFDMIKKLSEQAKEMEEQQIIDAYDVQWVENIKNGKDYYNETFKNK